MIGSIADAYDAFLLDLDGVLFRGAEPIPGAPDAVRRLRAAGKGVAFVTNNSSRTPEQVVEHLASVGIGAEPEDVETSALATAATLAARGVRRAFVIGERGLRQALTDAGIAVQDDAPDVVVVGWDRDVDYGRLRDASIAVQRGAALIASNHDASYPAADGSRWPGGGAIAAAIEVTCGIGAEVIGKPEPPILEAALRRAGGGRPLVVGDRLDTDVEGAARLGWDSCLVLTGVATRAEVDAAPVRPTHVVPDVSALVGGAAGPEAMLAIERPLEDG